MQVTMPGVQVGSGDAIHCRRFAMQWPEFENMSARDIYGAGAESIPASPLPGGSHHLRLSAFVRKQFPATVL